VQERALHRVAGERLVEPHDRGGGCGQRLAQRRIRCGRRPEPGIGCYCVPCIVSRLASSQPNCRRLPSHCLILNPHVSSNQKA
jgi:hypothetical protein